MSYIHEGAHASYVHWWTQQLYWVNAAYRWDEFRSAADDIGYLYPHLRKPRRWRRRNHGSSVRRWIKPWDVSTSGESSFRQSGFEKKTISDEEQARRDWREKKGFKRDRAKPGNHRYCNAGWYGKRQVHRARRQHEREMIKHERFDELTQNVQDVTRQWWD